MDICETDKKLAYDVHINGTKNILDGCKSVNAKMVFISTSAVFDGKKEIYNEYDETCAISYYGITKAEAEGVIKKSGLDFLIVRTDHPYGWVDSPGQKKNTVVRALGKLERGEVVEEITDWYNNPTFVDNLSEVIKKLIGKNAEGIYHAAGHDFINRYEFAVKIAEVFGKDPDLIKKKTSDKLNLPAKRTNCNLDSSKAQSETGIKLLGIEEGLKEMKKQYQA
jgi:dTDP-4-dehydrorhamnose reductase